MNIENIQAFMAVARSGSFAEVARIRGCAPSSVSRSIATLEGELGIRLFHRTTRRLSLTEAGQTYRARVEPLLEELRRAGELARDLVATPQGDLRIAVAASFAQFHLSGWLPEFLDAYPQVNVQLLLDARYVDLAGDRIDVALRLGRFERASGVARVLCDMPRVVVGAPELEPVEHPRSLAERDCLLFPFSGFSPTWKFRSRAGDIQEVRPRGRLVAGDGLLLRSLALAGRGIALLPRWICAEELARGELVDLCPDYDVSATEFDAQVMLIYPERKYLPLKVRAFVDFIRGKFRGGPPWEIETHEA
ncbi:MAG: LysR substrate-binding domain-containing protein [Myxococcota bacterium]